MKVKKISSFFINLVCGLAWVLPVLFFARYFLDIRSIHEILNKDTMATLFFSIKQSLYSTFIAFLVALLPAYYGAYKNNFLSKMINGLIFIPFFFPVISVVTIFSIVFNLDFF